MVAMANRPGDDGSMVVVGEDGGTGRVGARRKRELDVFFWRREYVFSGVFRSAAVSEASRVRL